MDRLVVLFGTPAYMAPEQWSAAATSPSADLYATGCILYEMLTGQLPFNGPTPPAFMAQHLTQLPKPPRDLKPGIPAQLDDLVLALLAKKPEDRPASAAGILAVLTSIQNGQGQAPPLPLPATITLDALQKMAKPAKAPETRLPSRPIRTLTSRAASGTAMAFSSDGRYLATQSFDAIQLWKIANGKNTRTLTSRSASGVPISVQTFGVAFSPDGRYLATGCEDGTTQLWKLAIRKSTCSTLAGHAKGVYAVAFSPDSAYLATGSSDNTARLWDVSTGQTVRIYSDPILRSGLRSVAFSPDGTLLATSSSDGTAQIWHTATGRVIHRLLNDDRRGITYRPPIAFSPGGTLLAAGGEGGTTRLWDVATGQAVRALTAGFRVRDLTFSPDGTHLATAAVGDDTVRMWDTASGQIVHTIYVRGVWSVAFSPDGTHLATCSSDDTIRIWA